MEDASKELLFNATLYLENQRGNENSASVVFNFIIKVNRNV